MRCEGRCRRQRRILEIAAAAGFVLISIAMSSLAFADSSLSGTVLGRSGSAEEAVDVVYKSEKDFTQERTTTDINGRYSFLGLASGLAQVRTQPNVGTGYTSKRKYLYLQQDESVSGFDFNLEEGALIEGVLTVAGDGSHPNNILIDAVGSHFEQGWVVSGYNGAYGDGYYSMRFRPAGYFVGINGGSAEFITLPGALTVDNINDNKKLDITLYRVPDDCSVIEGTIDINVRPHEDSIVALLSCDAGVISSLKPGRTGFMSVLAFENEAVSCRYSMALVSNHVYDMAFGLWNRSREGITSFTFISTAQDVIVEDRLFEPPVFSFDNIGGEVSGRVADSAGNPVLMAQVDVFDARDGRYVAFAMTDQNGEYHVYNVPQGEYVVYADHQDYWLEQAELNAVVTEGGVTEGVNIAFGRKGVVLWNKLGSDYEVTHSEIGPDLIVQGSLSYDPCKFDGGVHSPVTEIDHLSTDSSFVSRKEGCVEFWWKPVVDWDCPDRRYRSTFFGIHTWGNSIPDDSSAIGFYYATRPVNNAFTLMYTTQDAESNNVQHVLMLPAYPFYAGDLIHLAAVWDVNGGIEGQYSLAIYQDGKLLGGLTDTIVPAANWASDLDVAGRGTDFLAAWEGCNGPMDNIKIWNYAKTDFFDRFDEGVLLLWNKLGSDDEVTHSEIGPAGEIVGKIFYEPCYEGDGFRSAVRTGDPNIPDNFVRFSLALPPQGCVEFWYHPDWEGPAIGHVTNLVEFGFPEAPPFLDMSYNDWQDRFISFAAVYDESGSEIVGGGRHKFDPSQQDGWSNNQPFHLAFSWDSSKEGEEKLAVYLNGEAVAPSVFDNYGKEEFTWPGPAYLYVGCRNRSGDWDRHHWEPNIDGVIDEIKVWNYPKRKFYNRPPVAEDIEAAVDEDTPIEIKLAASDPDGDELVYSIIDFPSHGSVFSVEGNIVAYTPQLNYNGKDAFTYIASDGKLDSNLGLVTITINPVNDAPFLAPIGAREVDENQLLEFTVNAVDVDSPDLVYSASGLPKGAVFEPVTRMFSWTPTYEQAGKYEGISFAVSDTDLVDSEDITITVHDVNRPPVVSALAEPMSGKSISLVVHFSSEGTYDPDGDTISYLWDFKDGHTSTEPNPKHRFRESGDFDVSLTVKDSRGGEETATVLIEVYNRRPKVSTRNWPKKVKEGETVRFWGSARDKDGYIDQYEWRSDIDGVLSNQPRFSTRSLSVGKHTITFKARDNYGDWSKTVKRKLDVKKAKGKK